MALNDIWLVRVVNSLLLTGQNRVVAFNLLHYRVFAETGSGATAANVAAAMEGPLAPVYRAIFDSETFHLGVLATKIFPFPSGATAGNTGLAGGGTRAPGEKQPSMNSGIITKRTALAGRKFRGRVYIPFPLEDDNTATGQTSVLYGSLLLGIADALIAPRTAGSGGNTADLQPCIYHGPVGAPPRFTDCTSMVTRIYWGTQRKRNPAFHSDTVPLFPP